MSVARAVAGFTGYAGQLEPAGGFVVAGGVAGKTFGVIIPLLGGQGVPGLGVLGVGPSGIRRLMAGLTVEIYCHVNHMLTFLCTHNIAMVCDEFHDLLTCVSSTKCCVLDDMRNKELNENWDWVRRFSVNLSPVFLFSLTAIQLLRLNT